MQAIHKISAPAGFTFAILAAKEANADTLAKLPFRDVGTYLLDAADHLVSGHSRKCEPGIVSPNRGGIGMADAAGLNTNENLPRLGLGNLPFSHSKLARRRYFHSFICVCH
jgi:hypothetical protein